MPPASSTKIDLPGTKFVELISNQTLTTLPVIAGVPSLFEQNINVDGWKEIRLWVNVMVDNYQRTPITPAAKLHITFFHTTATASADYEEADIPKKVTSYIGGYVIKPIIGKDLRIFCYPVSMPPPPYRLTATYLLVR
jgi:hypothetical protein